MNLNVSVLQPQRLLKLVHTPMDVLRVGVWCFALLHLMFLVPKHGFHWVVWIFPAESRLLMPDALSGLMILLGLSLLPAALALDVWQALRTPHATLRAAGVAAFVLGSLAGTGLVGLGLPLLYTTYLYPGSHLMAYPYLMVLGGFVVWTSLLWTRRLMVRPADG